MDPMTLAFANLSTDALVIIMIFGIPIVAIIGGILLEIVKVITRNRGRDTDKKLASEIEMVQKMHEMLLRMEDRIESLETILIENERKDGER